MLLFDPLRRLAPPLLLLALIAGCGGDSAGEPPQAEVEMTAAEILEIAAERMEEIESFAFLLEHENGVTTIVRGMGMERAEGAVSGSDRLRADVRTRAGPVTLNLGVIILPEGSWITNPFNNQWESEALSISQFFDPSTGITALMRDLDEASRSGMEPIGGEMAYRIDASVRSEDLLSLVPAALPGRTLTVRSWIGVEDPRVLRIDILGALEAGDAENLVRRLLLSGFGGDFAISAPR